MRRFRCLTLIFFGNTPAELVADLHDEGAFNQAWSEVAKPIAQAFRAYERALAQLRAAHPGLFGTQIAIDPREGGAYPGNFDVFAKYTKNPQLTVELFGKLLNNQCYTSQEVNAFTATDLAGYAEAILRALDDSFAERNRTVAVLATKEGAVLVASGGANLTPEQRALASAFGMDPLSSGPVDVSPDAEITAVNTAYQSGLSPMAMGVSRDICPTCAGDLRGRGAFVSGQIAAWP